MERKAENHGKPAWLDQLVPSHPPGVKIRVESQQTSRFYFHGKMTSIKVSLKSIEDRSYTLFIGHRCLKLLDSVLSESGANNDLFIITDENVKRCWAGKIERMLRGKYPGVTLLSIPPGENQKNLSTIEKLARNLLKMKADRKSILVALGGGVVGDITGFLASVFLRGVSFINIPTTLLAQVDSSVGGKTGVDLPEGKNLVGTFYQPKLVFIDIDFLSTLPDDEFVSGMAEVIKYGIILDESFFSFLESNTEKVLMKEPEPLTRMVYRSCELKKNVVEKDEKEAGLRRILNFGHTIGHSLETVSDYSIKHGMAVAVGMVVASHIAGDIGLLPFRQVSQIERVIRSFGLPTRIPSTLDPDKILSALSHDKKRVGSDLHWVLPTAIGNVKVLKGIEEALVSKVLKRLQVTSC